MSDKPILFSGEMVRALLDGRKTQTRRIVNEKKLPIQFSAGRGDDVNDPRNWGYEDDGGDWAMLKYDGWNGDYGIPCPYGQPGDYLWVRETWAAHWMYDDVTPSKVPSDRHALIKYVADGYVTQDCIGADHFRKNRPSIFMPRWASRLTLKITRVTVERLQDISEWDCDAEMFGGDFPHNVMPEFFSEDAGDLSIQECFGRVWDSINGNWSENPWVWVIEFEVIKANIDIHIQYNQERKDDRKQ